MTSLRPGTLQEMLYIWLRNHPGWHTSVQIANATHEERAHTTRALDALYAKALVERRMQDDTSRWHRRLSEFRYLDPPDGERPAAPLRRTCPRCHARSRNIVRHYEYEHPGEKYRP